MNLAGLIKKRSIVVSVALLLFFCWARSTAAQDMDTDKWQFDISFYLWATDIGGTVSQSNPVLPGAEIDMDINDIIDNLNMTFMGMFEVRKNRWSLIADTIYLDVGNDKDIALPTKSGASVNANVDMDIATWILTGAVGYNVIQGEKGILTVIGGVRYASMDADVTIDVMGIQGDQSNSEELVDGVVGLRGVINLNKNWYLPYYADIGAGNSDLTWQALGGVGYRFGWGDIKLVYRYLSYEMEDDQLLSDLDVSGPALGVVFRF